MGIPTVFPVNIHTDCKVMCDLSNDLCGKVLCVVAWSCACMIVGVVWNVTCSRVYRKACIRMVLEWLEAKNMLNKVSRKSLKVTRDSFSEKLPARVDSQDSADGECAPW